jgi:hypothetical protein
VDWIEEIERREEAARPLVVLYQGRRLRQFLRTSKETKRLKTSLLYGAGPKNLRLTQDAVKDFESG